MDGHTHARLLGESGLETLVAAAVIGAGGVGAVSMVAGAAGAFIYICRQSTLSPRLAGFAPHLTRPPLTNALPPDVLLVARVTLAAVAGRGGQAAAIQTQVGEVSADINGLVQGGCACNRDNGALVGPQPRVWVLPLGSDIHSEAGILSSMPRLSYFIPESCPS